MSTEIVHKTEISSGRFLALLAVVFGAGFVLGLNWHATSAAETPTIPEPSRTVQTIPYP